MAFARKAYGGEEGSKPDYEAIPSAVFSSPPIATVGLTEEQAAESHKNVDIYTSSFKYITLPPSASVVGRVRLPMHVLLLDRVTRQ